MLVLSRKLNEKIVIDDKIEITVVGIENGQVQLGIDAPREVEIIRKELIEEVTEENRAAVLNSESVNKLKDFKLKK